MPEGPGCVVDASVAIKWIIAEQDSDAALALQGEDMIAPALLRIETANVLRTLVGRRIMSADTAAGLFAFLQTAPAVIVDHDEALERRALEIALELGHPVYDCTYLALAERTGRILVTADRRFITALGDSRHASSARSLSGDVRR